jgi:hypothetical protein
VPKKPIKYHMVLDDPEYIDHALALGRMLGHWGELESCLMLITKFLLKTDYDEKAYFVYKEFTSLRAKINLLKKLNQWFPPDKPIKDEIDNLLSDVEFYNDMRNSFIHARWVSKAGYGVTSNKLMRISFSSGNLKRPNKRPKYFTPQNIQGFGEEVARLCQCFYDLLTRVSSGP